MHLDYPLITWRSNLLYIQHHKAFDSLAYFIIKAKPPWRIIPIIHGKKRFDYTGDRLLKRSKIIMNILHILLKYRSPKLNDNEIYYEMVRETDKVSCSAFFTNSPAAPLDNYSRSQLQFKMNVTYQSCWLCSSKGKIKPLIMKYSKICLNWHSFRKTLRRYLFVYICGIQCINGYWTS